jgi:hypothetical protein
VFLNLAFTLDGPAGPVTAISAMSSPALVVVMALVNWKMISAMELIACLFGMYGALLMSNHKFFEKRCFCCCLKNMKGEKEEDPDILFTENFSSFRESFRDS